MTEGAGVGVACEATGVVARGGKAGVAAWLGLGFALAGIDVAKALLSEVDGSVISGFFDEHADKPAARIKTSEQVNPGKRRHDKNDIGMAESVQGLNSIGQECRNAI